VELAEIEVKPGIGSSIEAELRADVAFGDKGYWLTIGGWGGTEAEARAQIEAAMQALRLSAEKIGKAV